MIVRAIKYPLRLARQKFREWSTYRFVSSRVSRAAEENKFDFESFRISVLKFVDTLKVGGYEVQFKYSHQTTKPTLYASAYACMTYSLLGKLDDLSSETKQSWVNYFNSFQSPDDGLFYDAAVQNEHYDDSDWWGARHLAVHMISAYTQLGARPVHPFLFLKPYYNLSYLERFLRDNEWAFKGQMANDFDNKLMNLGCVLQYQRDYWQDDDAAKSIKFIQDFLLSRLNPKTGIWGDDDLSNEEVRSRKVQFAYHLLPLFLYDNIYDFDFEKIIDVTLKTQNQFGGYGVKPNSSACDDIDSVDILVRFAKFSASNQTRIRASLVKGMKWNCLNQVSDGGFVFRLNEPFVYGHIELSSSSNQGAIFPTWFRTLNMAYLCEGLAIPAGFKIVRCPGYEF